MSHIGYLRDKAARDAARTFEAKFQSRCPACMELINPEDLCRWDDDRVFMHADCDAAVPADAPTTETCPTCHESLAVNGTCGGCD